VYDSESPKTLMDIWTLPLSGDRKPTPFLQTKFSEGQGRLSPDSRWLAYVSNETGRNEVYVQPFPPAGGKWQISTGGGIQPQWRKDGKELYYLSLADQGLISITAVDVRSTAATFDVSVPKSLFAIRFASNASFSQPALSSTTILQSYAPSADGQRFFVLTPGNDRPLPPITVVMNWTAGLNK
jgi:Tol biopolymer transport system component